jgi:hypothetical protein
MLILSSTNLDLGNTVQICERAVVCTTFQSLENGDLGFESYRISLLQYETTVVYDGKLSERKLMLDVSHDMQII